MGVRSTSFAWALLACGLAFAPTAARAGTIPAAEISYDMALLSQFNLVTLGNYQSSGLLSTRSIDGRAIVGGNVSTGLLSSVAVCASATACASGSPTAAIDNTNRQYGALTVFGNLTGTVSVGTATGANNAIAVGGNASGTLSANRNTVAIRGTTSGLTVDNPGGITTASKFSGTVTNNQARITPQIASAAAVFPFSSAGLSSEMNNLSKGIANLPGSPGVSAKSLTVGDSVFFTASTDYTYQGKKYSVITTTMADLSRETNFRGIDNKNGSDSIFVIVTGDGANYTLPNLNSYADASKVIFNFVDATTLKFAGNWNGSILAPLATITQMGGAIDGSVVVSSINQTNALYANNLFTGTLQGLVPEPASIALIGVGLAGAALLRRRRAA